MLTCDVCGKLHPAGTQVCDVCGTNLTTWPYVANSDLGQELGLDRLPANSELGRVLAAPLRELTGTLCPACANTNRPGALFCAFCGQSLAAAPPPAEAEDAVGRLAPGIVLQRRYRIVRRVAQGGMGAVYEAYDQETPDQRWAVKEMVQSSIAPEDRIQALKDFMREATILATLHHPNLPRFRGIFMEDGKHYLVMEFVAGHTLEQVVSTSTAFLPESRVLYWAAQLCDALNHLHAQDPPIIYRDTKPGNIMLLDGGQERIKLIDFGIARFHRGGHNSDTAAFGTAGYAPPEQYGNGQTDQRSDVYALAATLHHLLSGHDPVQNPFHWRPVRSYNPYVSRKVDQAIMRALELKAELRFESIDAFARALGLRPVPAPGLAHPTAVLPDEIPGAPPTPTHIAEPAARNGAAEIAEKAPARAAAAATPTAAPVPAVAPLAGGPPLDKPYLDVPQTVIDLGVAGRQARRGQRVKLVNSGQGELKGIVHVTQPWMAATAVQFQGKVGEFQVRTRRGGLKLGHLAAPVPNVFGGARRRLRTLGARWALLAWLAGSVWIGSQVGMSASGALFASIGLLIGLLVAVQVLFWLVARHVRWFIPAPLVNQGEVVIDSNGGQRRLEVRVLARPSWLRTAAAWLLLTVLLVGELVAAPLLILHTLGIL